MAYLEELLPEFRNGAKIRRKDWDKDFYIYMRDGFIYTKRGGLFKFEYEEFNTKDWEFYQKPIDWDYIIKNKCLCWFWDENKSEKVVGWLREIVPSIKYKFNGAYLNCRPVSRDEITFFEGINK